MNKLKFYFHWFKRCHWLLNVDVLQSLRLDRSLSFDDQGRSFVGANEVSVDHQIWCDRLEDLLLGVHDWIRVADEAFAAYQIAGDGASWWAHDLDLIGGAGAHDHSFGSHTAHFGRFQVTENDDHSVLHLLNWHKFH